MAVEIDHPVADFKAQATSGQTISLAELKGRQVVLTDTSYSLRQRLYLAKEGGQ